MNGSEKNIKKIRKEIDTNPSEKQKECGNYKKGHISINGFRITIENPKNSYRSGVDSNGKEWKIKMNNDYGYFLNSEGYDGDHVDVFLGDDFNSKKIYVVDQFINGKFDESKVMLGFNDIDVAKQNYLKNYEKDWKGFKKITEVSEETFKKWLYDGKKQRKPFYDYKFVKGVKKMKIKESILRGLIQESIKKTIIKEGRESTKLTNMLIKKLYKVAQNYKKKYHDDDWSNVHAMLDEMGQLKGIADFFVEDGRYHKQGEEFGEMTKIYKVNVLTDFNTIINGNVNCHLCGTVDDPWSAYDISVSFYRGYGDKEIQESISKTLNEDIRSAVTNLFSKSDLVPNPTKQIQNVNINGKNVMAIVFDRKWIDDDFQKRINDFLLKNPSLEIATIDDNHAVIINKDAKEGEPLRINESVDNENFGEKPFYTMDDWRVDGSLKPEVGDYVEDEVIEELANSVPPTTYKSTLFQPGEAYTMSKDYEHLYMTFVNDGNWKYVGLCPKGTNKREMAYDEDEYLGESIIKEGKRGLNSHKLYQLAKEHGGLRPKHGYSFRRFNELTDDDVIGLIEKPELNRYENASWKVKKEWAEQKGYNVNRGDSVEFIPMADWSWVGVIVRGDLLPDKEWKETPYGKKITDRAKNKINDGLHHYPWSDTDTHGVEGLSGFSKRAHEFSMKKYNNDVKNSKNNK